jgi:hypothetical protein
VSNLEVFFEDEGSNSPRREAAIARLERMKARKYNPVVDNETRLRIRVAIYAYSYEYEADALVSDAEFDDLCSQVNLEINTRRPDLDKWFRSEFNPYTGQWIHNHPELDKIKEIYNFYYRKSNGKKSSSNRKKVKGAASNS